MSTLAKSDSGSYFFTKSRTALRRLLVALSLCLVPVVASAQTTVTGHVLLPNTTAPTNAKVCFTLTNFSPNVPRVIGTGAIVAQRNFCIPPAADGSFSTSLYGNNVITPTSTNWRVDLTFNNIQQSSATYLINHSPFNLDTETPLSATTPAGPNQVVTQAFPFTQLVAATTWTIPHNFNDPYTTVYVTDTSGNQIFPSTTNCRANPNICTLTFVAPTAGFATAMHAGGINIATSQPNVVLQNATTPQSVLQPFTVLGNLAATAGQNIANLYSLNNFRIVDGQKYPTTQAGLQQALTDAASTTGGVVIVPPGTTVSGITSTLTVGSTAGGTSALLYVAPSATLQFSINSSSTDAIHLSTYSTVACGLTRSSANGAIRGVSQAATTVRTVVSADQQNGNVEAIYVQGCQFSDVTVSRAVIDGSATFNNTAIRDNIVYNFTGSAIAPGILVASGIGATGAVGAVEITNNWVNPGTNTAGIIVNGVDPGGLGSASIIGVKLWGNQIEHTGTASMMVFTGNASNAVQNVVGSSNWLLPSSTIPNSYKMVDVVTCQQCNFTGTVFEPVGATANPVYGFYLESTFPNAVVDFHSTSPALNSFSQANFVHVFDNTMTPAISMSAFSDYAQVSTGQGSRGWRIVSNTSGAGLEIDDHFPNYSGNAVTGVTGTMAVTGNLDVGNPIRNLGGGSTMGITLKKGSGTGTDYTTTSTAYVAVDATNLAYTVTIPTGWKLAVNASGTAGVNTAVATVYAAIADGGTIVTEHQLIPTNTLSANQLVFSLSWAITGDGASHTVDLRFKTANAADSADIVNASSTNTASMVFTLMPSN
jgi:hypothetical protein